ncbi:MAG: carbamoyltransferase HypF [Thermodesulfovibrionales bacterium]|nr:carbamoyltransferase HypF [Thermodesulfovibrionales bacterium]
MKPVRTKIVVKGIVQGVGFRPFVYSLARSGQLKGFVLNSSEGVIIEIEGENTPDFIERLQKEAPPLSRIMSVDITTLPSYGYKDFTILKSKDAGSFTLISSDVSICQDCFRELLDKNDRRFLYPFINCTNCGPRYTITKSVPYDRPNTTMAVFKLCPDCDREYHDPLDRRFHAQPNACPVCGPQVQLKVKSEKLRVRKKTNPIEETIRLLKQGKIVAIKGLGGFHLACDAMNEDAVNRLRLKKRKSNKPFALMAPDIETIRKFCRVSEAEEAYLTSNKRPIVLLNKIKNGLPAAVSPHNPCIGFMLPYTPLHYLLFCYPMHSLAKGIAPDSSPFANGITPPSPPLAKGGIGGVHFDALVMTSGNIAEEPIVIENDEAVSKLSDIADAFLMHNRDIFMRADDSVVRVNSFITDPSLSPAPKGGNGGGTVASPGKNQPSLSFVRRSRGYVPDPVLLHEDGPEVLGCGADIKNIFTLTKGSFAIPSQHIGDMENYETLRFFEESLRNLKSVYRVEPVALAYDLHPMYLSTQWALRQENIKKIPIQHHYAHVGSVMAEKGIKEKVIGVTFDGTGYGTDGGLWGGEFLIADIKGFRRACHFRYIPLPGGEAAVKEPWRIAISYIKNITGNEVMPYLDSIGFVRRYGREKIHSLLQILDNRQFSPLSSGAGRLFDAISALIGVCDDNTFEGEAAIALEAITYPDIIDDYPVDIKFKETMEVDFSHTILRIMEDIKEKKEKGIIATKFHNTIITVIERVVEKLSSVTGIRDVALCGGVFQNMYLLERTIDRLRNSGMNVLIHDKVPTNDAGISLGQAYIIRERIKAGIL